MFALSKKCHILSSIKRIRKRKKKQLRNLDIWFKTVLFCCSLKVIYYNRFLYVSHSGVKKKWCYYKSYEFVESFISLSLSIVQKLEKIKG